MATLCCHSFRAKNGEFTQFPRNACVSPHFPPRLVIFTSTFDVRPNSGDVILKISAHCLLSVPYGDCSASMTTSIRLVALVLVDVPFQAHDAHPAPPRSSMVNAKSRLTLPQHDGIQHTMICLRSSHNTDDTSPHPRCNYFPAHDAHPASRGVPRSARSRRASLWDLGQSSLSAWPTRRAPDRPSGRQSTENLSSNHSTIPTPSANGAMDVAYGRPDGTQNHPTARHAPALLQHHGIPRTQQFPSLQWSRGTPCMRYARGSFYANL
ncbi:hypothetical protein C8R46DRAFT_287828 [Mycena filopes]|nr:hypothetical protein C8R46DRAFT_287828 [Mycena filopes]